MKRDTIRGIVARLMILLSIVLLCAPAVSHIHAAVKAVRASVEAAGTDVDYTEEIEQVRLRNATLERLPLLHDMTEAETEQYLSLMDIAGTGILGRISIPKINVSLPIYHGDGDSVMQKGVGHMPASSLPVVCDSSHVVLSGHSGLAAKPMFTELPKLEVGDTFQITALGQTLVYEVDQILTVLPHEVDVIELEPGIEYCTLVTCTPVGLNTHRLLVRGHRVEAAAEDAGSAHITADVLREVFHGNVLAVYEVVLLGVALALLVVGLLWPLGRKIYEKNRKSKNDCA